MKILISEIQLKKLVSEQILPYSAQQQYGDAMKNVSSQTWKMVLPLTPVIGQAIGVAEVAHDFYRDINNAKSSEDKGKVITSYIVSIGIGIGIGKLVPKLAKLAHEARVALSRKIYLGKPLNPSELDVVRDIASKSTQISQLLKNNKTVSKFVSPNEIPKVLYHGSTYDFGKKDIDIFRKGVDLSFKTSGSAKGGVGLYLTPNLKSDAVKQPVEYARKWGSKFGATKGIVYQTKLSPDIKLIKTNDIAHITPQQAEQYLKQGVDGLVSHGGDEMVILNKNKIKTFIPFEKYDIKYTTSIDDFNSQLTQDQLNQALEKKLGSGFRQTFDKFGNTQYYDKTGNYRVRVNPVGNQEWKQVDNPSILKKVSNYFSNLFSF